KREEHHEVRLHSRKSRFPTFLRRHYRRPPRTTSEAQCGGSAAHVEVWALADKNLRCVLRCVTRVRLREVPEVWLRPRICEEAPLMLKASDGPDFARNAQRKRP